MFPIQESYRDEHGNEALLLPTSSKARIDRKDEDEENVYGVTLYREEENIYSFTPYEYVVDEYINLEIKKFFGYTLDQYLELGYYEVEVLKNKAMKLKEEMAKAYDKLSNKSKDVKVSPEAYSMINEDQSALMNGED